MIVITAKTTLRPLHDYSIPGGVLPRKLGEIKVTILSEIERGGPDRRAWRASSSPASENLHTTGREQLQQILETSTPWTLKHFLGDTQSDRGNLHADGSHM
jgi:hypothetical protein